MFEIAVRGRPPQDWADWFDGFTADVRRTPGGTITTLTGPIVDQAALHGVLATCRDLALSIVSVRELDADLRPLRSPDAHLANTPPGEYTSRHMTRRRRIRTVESHINSHRNQEEHDMNTLIDPAPDLRTDAVGVRRLKTLLAAAAALCAVAALAGIGLLLLDPASGSTTEGALGVTAAVAGLGVGALAIAAAIYAQSRNLWRFAAGWFRWAVMGLIVVAVVRSTLSAIGSIG